LGGRAVSPGSWQFLVCSGVFLGLLAYLGGSEWTSSGGEGWFCSMIFQLLIKIKINKRGKDKENSNSILN
jgi:hypothetical protein